jgi:phosphoribosylpyrophosphate synthetase
MRNTLIFAGSSCPKLTGQICSNLGMAPAPVELTQFANVNFSMLQIDQANVKTLGRNQRQNHDQYS